MTSRPLSRLLTVSAAGLLAAVTLLTPGTGAAAATADHSVARSAVSAQQEGSASLTAAAGAVRDADIPGTAWAVAPDRRSLRVSADSTVAPAELAELRRALAPFRTAVSLEQDPGTLRPFVSGGDPIYASAGWRCRAGFNARNSTSEFLITAGHCTDGFPSWYADPGFTTYIGPTTGTSFPSDDYGLVRYDNPNVARPGTVGPVDITGAGNAYVGQSVCMYTSTRGMTCGTVRAVNATVNYADGTVYGMIQTNICAEPGDSGSPLISGSLGLGTLSGGSGSCETGGTTYFNPVTEVLNAYGLTLY